MLVCMLQVCRVMEACYMLILSSCAVVVFVDLVNGVQFVFFHSERLSR